MNSKFRKNLTNLLGLAILVTIFASCSRGGYGCPYELEIAADALNCLIK